jgi:hypothetical protein
MSTAAKIAPPTLRLASLDDGQRISLLEVSQQLSGTPPDGWNNLWLNNPLWPRLRQVWLVGWLLEDAEGRLVGSLVNIPTLYTFRGRELICANGRGWAVAPEFRGFAPQLMGEYFDQPNVDLFINTTVGRRAAPIISILSDRVPVGNFQTVLFWVTGYRGIAEKALQRVHVPAFRIFVYAAAAALRLKDALTAKPLPAVSKSIVVEFADGFDARFDAFWNELVQQNFDKLLAVRDRRTLAWHFEIPLRTSSLWIITATRNGLLRAYGIFNRQGRTDGIPRMQLVDYQTLDPDQDLLPGLLQAALQRCVNENLLVLEQVGCGVPKQASFDGYAPYRRKLRSWCYYFRAADPAIHAELARPAVWDPSMFDGDAHFE